MMPSGGEHAERFTLLRPLLFTIAYEILGSATEADDVLQDSYLRWADVDLAGVRDTKSYLARLVTRQALNALRADARRREEYVGPWLPEPLLLDEQDPSADVVLAESVSMAMLVLLETLSPDERAVFVLREVFGFDHGEIAEAVGKPTATVRQIAHRAREHVRARRKRFDVVDPQRNAEITAQFLATAASGDVDALMAMLAPDATWTADSGGVVSAARRPVVGAERVARAIVGLMRKAAGADLHVDMVTCNSAPAVLLYLGEQLEGVITLEIIDDKITNFYVMRNPEKLTTLTTARGSAGTRCRQFCQARAVRIDRLGDLGGAPAVLRAVGHATGRLGLPPPAALTGDWFDALAVIAPSLAAQPVDVDDVFAVRPAANAGSDSAAVGGGWFGYLSYPDPGADGRPARIPEAAGGWTDCVLRRDRDAQWWYESLSGAPMPDWLAGALAALNSGTRPLARLLDRLGRARPGGPSQRRTCLSGGDPRRRDLPGVRVHAVHRDGQRGPAGLLRRRSGTHFSGARGLCRWRMGCGGIAVSGAFPSPPRERRNVEPDQGHPAVGRLAVGAAGFGQRRGREHHDRGSGPQ